MSFIDKLKETLSTKLAPIIGLESSAGQQPSSAPTFAGSSKALSPPTFGSKVAFNAPPSSLHTLPPETGSVASHSASRAQNFRKAFSEPVAFHAGRDAIVEHAQILISSTPGPVSANLAQSRSGAQSLLSFDREKLAREVESIVDRATPSPFPVPSSTADTFPADLFMSPLPYNFSDKTLLLKMAKHHTKEEHIALNQNYRQEKEFYESALPAAQRKILKLRGEIDDLRIRGAHQPSEGRAAEHAWDREELRLPLKAHTPQARPQLKSARGEVSSYRPELGYSLSAPVFTEHESVRTLPSQSPSSWRQGSYQDLGAHPQNHHVRQPAVRGYTPTAPRGDQDAGDRSRSSTMRIPSGRPATPIRPGNPLLKLPKF